MTFTDWTGFAGVSILLLAYLLSAMKRLSTDHIVYMALNLAGAGIACFASVLLHYWPFIILEGAWALVSLVSLIKHFGRA